MGWESETANSSCHDDCMVNYQTRDIEQVQKKKRAKQATCRYTTLQQASVQLHVGCDVCMMLASRLLSKSTGNQNTSEEYQCKAVSTKGAVKA